MTDKTNKEEDTVESETEEGSLSPSKTSSESSDEEFTVSNEFYQLGEEKKREHQKRLEVLLDRTAMYTQFLSSSLGKETYVANSANVDNSTSEPDKKKRKTKDSSASKPAATATSIVPQPPTVTGGVLRQYQLDALNWLIQLFENGIYISKQKKLKCCYNIISH